VVRLIKGVVMADNVNLDVLSTRKGFNTAVKYIKDTVGIASSAGSSNLGDILFKMDDDELTSAKVGFMLRMLLVDKLGYRTASTNLNETAKNFELIAKEFSKWGGVDLVAAYHHPELGLLIANPKVAEELAEFGELRKHEMLAIYAGFYGKETNENCDKAAALALKVFEGSKVTVPPALARGKYMAKKVSKPRKAAPPKPVKKVKAAVKTQAKKYVKPDYLTPERETPTGKPAKMTPRYSVIVQNELFHNGNVEAWKRIIASYKAKYPDLQVFIYYEKERIQDINSLFKWGKVKHGCAIDFAVAGNNIQDVAKLQRYLTQGASHLFEAFLKGQVNTVLKLF
jgi:hypothetical protein